QGTAQGGGEPGPERAGVGLPQHRPLVVIGGGVDGGAEAGVGGVVPIAAAARDHVPAPGERAGVDRPEGGGGEGEEGARVFDTVPGTPLASSPASPARSRW